MITGNNVHYSTVSHADKCLDLDSKGLVDNRATTLEKVSTHDYNTMIDNI